MTPHDPHGRAIVCGELSEHIAERRARVAAKQKPSLAQNVACALLGGILLLAALYGIAVVLDQVLPPEVNP